MTFSWELITCATIAEFSDTKQFVRYLRKCTESDHTSLQQCINANAKFSDDFNKKYPNPTKEQTDDQEKLLITMRNKNKLGENYETK